MIFYMDVRFVRLHKVILSIYLFLTLMMILHYLKPKIIYDENGGFRPFGLGYRNKTILPIWLVSIFIAILSYLLILIYTRI